MGVPNGENRREYDRRLEQHDERLRTIGEAVAVLKAEIVQLEEGVRQVMPLVLEHSELRSEIKSLIRGDVRLNDRIGELAGEVEEDRKAREREREKREEREELERKEAKERRATEKAERRRDRWRNIALIAAAFVTSTGAVIAAILAAPK